MEVRKELAMLKYFDALRDKRMRQKVKYSLAEILLVSIAAVIGGAEAWEDIELFAEAKLDWFRQFLPFVHGAPSAQTVCRVIATLDPEAFQRSLREWFHAIWGLSEGRLVAIDGKTLRRSMDTALAASPLHLVSAWCQENGITLGQIAVDAKSNEITAIPKLLEMLDLTGAIVTLDAMGCQRAIAESIVRRGGDYVLAVKGNQPQLYEAISMRFSGASATVLSSSLGPCLETVDKGHGRLEIRRYWQTEELSWLEEVADQWLGLKSIGFVQSVRIIGDKESEETRFYVSNLEKNLEQFAAAVRGHWSIESSLHWSLDVTFGEDLSRIRKNHGAENFSTLRRIALSLLRRASDKKSRSLRGKSHRAGWDNAFLTRVIGAGLPCDG